MSRVMRLIRNKRLRQAAAALIIVITFGAFAYYLALHPEVVRLLSDVEPTIIFLLSLAYTGTVIANAFVLYVSLRLIGKRVSFFENIALTGYSSVVNFFGPLQSGPGFRAAYLKKRHRVSVKRFFYVTVTFYGFFAALNGLILAGAAASKIPSMWLVVFCTLCAAVAFLSAFIVLKTKRLQLGLHKLQATRPAFWLIGIGALLLSAATMAAYYLELSYIDQSISPVQAVVYTAAANLALFVSLTPGAIGFRESFLLLSQRLHEIPVDTIIAASVLDRAFYVVFLLVLFITLLALGVANKFKLTKRETSEN